MPVNQPPTPSVFYMTPPPSSAIFNLGFHGTLVVVDDGGTVKIDWKAVEETIADPHADRTALAYARMLLAARDGTWKPLPDSSH